MPSELSKGEGITVKTVASIFARDLRRILRNPIALLVAIGICVVPCLYAWINIAANWDPYENTSDIPVAIVNQDQPVVLSDMGEICTGDMLVEALEKNDKIGWTFVDEDKALEGVRAGSYYAAIVIPPDFSSSLTSVLDGSATKAHLRYYVNEKVNAISPKVADTGASTIETQIDDQFAATAGEVIAEKLGGAANRLLTGSQASVGNASDALDRVKGVLGDLDTQLGDLSDGLTRLNDSLTSANGTLVSLKGSGERVANNLAAALESFNETRTNANNLMSDINAALGDAAASISSLSSQASYDVSELAGDISLAQSQVNAAIAALENSLTDDKGLTSSVDFARDLVLDIDPLSDSGRSFKLDIDRSLSIERDRLVNLSDDQSARLDELRALSSRLQSAADEVAGLSKSLNERVQSATSTIIDAQNGTVSTKLLEINSALDSFVQVAQRLETASRQIDPLVEQASSVTSQLIASFNATKDALSSTRKSLAGISGDIDRLSDDLSLLGASQLWDVVKEVAAADPQGVHDFLTAPVELNEHRLFAVDNYASGVAPFFTSLALWVGGIALVAIFKLEVDDEGIGRIRPWEAFFARWLLFILLGFLQAVVCCTGDLIIGIQCLHPVAFYLSAMVASFTFISIIFSLAVAFKHIGKALAFTLVILQVPGSAGMYPIEMMPPFFQAINPWLPFTYSCNAMREAIAGFYDNYLLKDLLTLLLFVAPALLIGVTARSHLVNVNALFDRKLSETDHLLVNEPFAANGNRFRLATVVKAMHTPVEYRETFELRAERFEKRYPKLVARGILALLTVPLVLFVLMLLHEAKLPLLGAWVVALVAIYSFLIFVEYFHDRIERKRELLNSTPEELEEVLHETLRDEFMPLAPIDAIIDRREERREKLARLIHGGESGEGEGEPGEGANEPSEDADKPGEDASEHSEDVSPEGESANLDNQPSEGGDAR